jgi:hypothetical protein
MCVEDFGHFEPLLLNGDSGHRMVVSPVFLIHFGAYLICVNLVSAIAMAFNASDDCVG